MRFKYSDSRPLSATILFGQFWLLYQQLPILKLFLFWGIQSVVFG
jgi:hypothetical protein